MAFYKHFLFPLLKHSDPEKAHERASRWLEFAQWTGVGRAMLRQVAGRIPDRPVEAFGLTFPNVIGIAAGYDKDARVAPGLAELGFGHVEVGTLTPRPQAGNERPRIFRLVRERALINRMGFPNGGVRAALPRLRAMARGPGRRFVLGVSIGKQKETPLERAADDYIELIRAVYTAADYLAVNISSPNTPGLRELQGGRFLENLCGALVAECGRLAEKRKVARRPLLVKIAPDLEKHELDQVLGTVLGAGVDGIIATNTTIGRPGVRDRVRREAGGLSGAPLAERSNSMIRHIHRETGGRLPIIGVGGVYTADDVRRKMDAGAVLVQVYTGLVYEGPAMAGKILRDLEDG